ncbi:uncharacterized protein LOC113170908 isoform X2 [Anabas testudineus]|uniref:uncharacterized protein LOC113170908 isoform X2 n=1 Tax=Anabas testudineus TaxID=64144 RepID=UPI000E462150|nr:uncharacterized protein LOC113170908 isoform X2 [Anabas testudineus]
MSVTVTKDKGVIVVTMKTDNKNIFPPLCQILWALCCNPVWFKVQKGLMQTKVTAVLGTIQIMVGLFTTGLEAGRASTNTFFSLYWLGAVYIMAGITSLLSGRFPSTCLLGFSVLVNIGVAALTIVGVGLYAADLQGLNPALPSQRLLTGIDIALMILAFLQMCICNKMVVLCMTALVRREKEEVGGDFDIYKPILKEVMTSPGA